MLSALRRAVTTMSPVDAGLAGWTKGSPSGTSWPNTGPAQQRADRTVDVKSTPLTIDFMAPPRHHYFFPDTGRKSPWKNGPFYPHFQATGPGGEEFHCRSWSPLQGSHVWHPLFKFPSINVINGKRLVKK